VKRIQTCPSCNNQILDDLFECQDYFLSKELFSISECNQCKLLITNPQPAETELGHYYKSESYASHKTQAKSALDYVYMRARKYAIVTKFNLLKKYPHNHTILDYGCGTGDFLKYCHDRGWNVTGFEPSDVARKIAFDKLGRNIHGNKAELNKKEQFSIITLWHVLEHIPDIKEIILTLRSLVADNGKIIFALPNHESYDANHYGKYWAAYDVPRHLYHFSRLSIEYLLSNNGMQLDEVIPMKLDSYYISIMSERYKTNSSNYFKAFINGYKSNIYGRRTGNYSSLIYICSKC